MFNKMNRYEQIQSKRPVGTILPLIQTCLNPEFDSMNSNHVASESKAEQASNRFYGWVYPGKQMGRFNENDEIGVSFSEIVRIIRKRWRTIPAFSV